MTTARRRRKSEKTEQALAVWRYETKLEEARDMPRRSTPNKRSPEREQTILTALEWGATWEAAAKLAGVSYNAVEQWRRADPHFAAKVRLAKKRLQAKQREALEEVDEVCEEQLDNNKRSHMRPSIPNKWNDAKAKTVILRLRWGCSQKSAAAYAGVSEQTLHYWRNRDPSFDASVREAIEKARLERESALSASDYYPEEFDDADL